MLNPGASESVLNVTANDSVAPIPLIPARLSAYQPDANRIGMFVQINAAVPGAVAVTLTPVIEWRPAGVGGLPTVQYDAPASQVMIAGNAADDGTGTVCYREYFEMPLVPFWRVGLRVSGLTGSRVQATICRGSDTRA